MPKDTYAQIAFLTVTEAAANTLTFGGLSVFSNVLSQQAMIVHRIEYEFNITSLTYMSGTGDGMVFGLAGSDTISAITMADPQVYDENRFALWYMGTPATIKWQETPIVRDWTGMPGGGKLVPADRLYIYLQGISLANPATVVARVHFTLLEMSASEYLELAQSLRVLR